MYFSRGKQLVSLSREKKNVVSNPSFSSQKTSNRNMVHVESTTRKPKKNCVANSVFWAVNDDDSDTNFDDNAAAPQLQLQQQQLFSVEETDADPQLHDSGPQAQVC
jgi:hypothetical protein